MVRKVILRSASAAVLATASLAICGDLLRLAAAPARGGSIVYGDVAEPPDLSCLPTNDGSALRVCRLVADPLVDYDRDLKLVLRLAESFELSSDGRTVTFRLRKGVRWHDGQPFTADDVLYTVEQIRAPGSLIH